VAEVQCRGCGPRGFWNIQILPGPKMAIWASFRSTQCGKLLGGAGPGAEAEALQPLTWSRAWAGPAPPGRLVTSAAAEVVPISARHEARRCPGDADHRDPTSLGALRRHEHPAQPPLPRGQPRRLSTALERPFSFK
jgi:hypothetical protein